MTKQRTRRRRTRCAVARAIAVGAAVATLVAILGTGQALATTAPPDERVLERQGLIEQQKAEQRRTDAPAQQAPGWSNRPEPEPSPGPWIDDEQTAPNPPPPEQAGPGLAVPAVLAALVLVAALSAWWLRHRHRPEPTT
jgi:hypothetical protein